MLIRGVSVAGISRALLDAKAQVEGPRGRNALLCRICSMQEREVISLY